MNESNNIWYNCRACMKAPQVVKMLYINPAIAEKLDYIGGSFENETYQQLPEYICGECEADLEFVYNFVLKIKSSKLRILQHNVVTETQTEQYQDIEMNKEIQLYQQNVKEAESTFEITICKESPTMHDYDATTNEIKSEVDSSPPQVLQTPWTGGEEESKINVPLEENPNMCNICGKTFSNKANMLRHVREHQGRRFVCNYENCNSFFTQRSSLKIHILRHNGEKPFRCYLCEKSFVQHKSLKFHLRTHTGERPYKCENCEKNFSQKSNLIRHTKCHRKPSKPKRFQCSLCSVLFASKQSLLRHYFKRHSEQKDVALKTVSSTKPSTKPPTKPLTKPLTKPPTESPSEPPTEPATESPSEPFSEPLIIKSESIEFV